MANTRKYGYKPTTSKSTQLCIEFSKIDFMDLHYFASLEDVPVTQLIKEIVHVYLHGRDKGRLSRVYPLKQHKLP